MLRLGDPFLDHGDACDEKRIHHDKFSNLKTLAALNDNLPLTVRQAEHTQNVSSSTDTEQILRLWNFRCGILLGNKSNSYLLADRLLYCSEARGASNNQWHDRGGKEHRIPQR